MGEERMCVHRGGKVHIVHSQGGYILCGIGKRWSSQDITSVRSYLSDKATCLSCVRIAYSANDDEEIEAAVSRARRRSQRG
jgi:hypothetical protein